MTIIRRGYRGLSEQRRHPAKKKRGKKKKPKYLYKTGQGLSRSEHRDLSHRLKMMHATAIYSFAQKAWLIGHRDDLSLVEGRLSKVLFTVKTPVPSVLSLYFGLRSLTVSNRDPLSPKNP